jgi:hypothetical protein
MHAPPHMTCILLLSYDIHPPAHMKQALAQAQQGVGQLREAQEARGNKFSESSAHDMHPPPQ